MSAILSSGSKIGRYEIRSQLGVGGMGEVYLAEDTRLHRRVALKVLPAAVASNQDRMRRFEQEATAAASLNHPNIAHIYEIAEAEDLTFIAMEYVDGVTLREKIHEEPEELSKLLRVLQHVADGLAKAHAEGIVHRDLKPDNIMITRDGHAKILDFGLAKLIEPQHPGGANGSGSEDATILQPHSTPGLILGTIGYMSPEQAQGKKEIDHRSDIFSFGCILFEVITRQKAFVGKDNIDSLNKIIREMPPPLSSFNPTIPSDLQRIVRRCLAKDPDERYQSIKDVALELKEVRRDLQDGVTSSSTSAGSTVVGGEAKTLWMDAGTRSQAPATATAVSEPAATRASSAEFIVTEIRRHKVASLVVAGVALLVLAAAGFGLRSYWHSGNTNEAIDSIAVIPFANQNKDPEADWVSDGISESLINMLTRLPNLRVIARNSVFRYKGKETDPLVVGKELGVRAVLTGRIMQRGDAMVVSAELVDVRDNKQLWGEQYERKLADMLSVQREIAHEITNNLRPALSGMEEKRASKQYTTNPEAYQLYVRGRYFWNKRTLPDFNKAISYFQQAIDKDPNYAMAYSGLADSYGLLNAYGSGPAKDSMPQAKAAALKALELDDNLAEAHASMGAVTGNYDYDFAGADREFRRALELNPNYATAHQWLAENLSVLQHHDEALAEIRRALELDPLSPIMNRIYADTLLYARRYDEAIDQYKKTLQLEPVVLTHFFLARAYEAKKMYPEAAAEYTKAAQTGDAGNFTPKEVDFQKLGWKAFNQEALNKFLAASQKEYVPPFVIAAFSAKLGQNDEAMAWLEKGYQERDYRMTLIQNTFEFDGLRDDPRFKDLVKRIGLPE